MAEKAHGYCVISLESLQILAVVIPAQAGIQKYLKPLKPGFPPARE
jgi:hypothetical protein